MNNYLLALIITLASSLLLSKRAKLLFFAFLEQNKINDERVEFKLY